MNDHTLQEQESQQRTLGDQPVHIVTSTDTISTWISGYPSTMLDFYEHL